jgi:hypothetical protein
MKRTSFAFLPAALVLLVSGIACNDDHSPTSPATPNISGNWQGTYQPGIAANFDPCDAGGPAAATFSQESTRVSGTLTTQNRSSVEGDFLGEFTQGSLLRGTVTNNGTAWTVSGSASAGQLTLSVALPFCSSTRIDLHR